MPIAERSPSDVSPAVWWSLLTAFGGMFLGFGVLLLLLDQSFARQALPAEGTVVEIRETPQGNADSRTWVPVIEFETAAGRRVRIDGPSTESPVSRGEHVAVLYMSQHPERARVNTFDQRWLVPSVFVPLGMALCSTGISRLRRPRVDAPLMVAPTPRRKSARQS